MNSIGLLYFYISFLRFFCVVCAFSTFRFPPLFSNLVCVYVLLLLLLPAVDAASFRSTLIILYSLCTAFNTPKVSSIHSIELYRQKFIFLLGCEVILLPLFSWILYLYLHSTYTPIRSCNFSVTLFVFPFFT